MLKGKYSGNLKLKIIGWSFIPTVIILLAVAWFTFYSYQNVTEELSVSKEKEYVQIQSSQAMSALIYQINPPLISILFNVETEGDDTLNERINRILSANIDLSLFDSGIAFLDTDGIVVRTTSEYPKIIGLDWSQDPLFDYVQQNPGRAAISDILSTELFPEPVVGIAVGIHTTQGDFMGAMVGLMKITSDQDSSMNQIFNAVGIEEDYFIVDNHQRIIYSTHPEEISQSYTKSSPWLYTLEPNGWVRDRQTNEIISFSGMAASGGYWRFVKQQQWEDLMAPSLGYRRLLLLLIGLGVLVPVIVVLVGLQRVTNPIQELITASEAVANGDFSKKIQVNTNDELEELAEQFNRMSAKLQESYATLENRVEDRTKELLTLNAISEVVSQSLDLSEILDNALGKTLEKTALEVGAAFRIDVGRKTSSLMTYRGLRKDFVDQITYFPLVSNTVLDPDQTSKIVLIDVVNIPDNDFKKGLDIEGITQIAIIPLVSKNKTLGFFFLGSFTTKNWSDEEVALLRAIGQQVGVAMENARLYERAEEAAVVAERTRLARELHDAVTQTLFSASLVAEVLPELWKINPGEAAKRTVELRGLTRGALAEMRTLLLELRPASLRELNLGNLLKQLTEAVSGKSRTSVDLVVQGNFAIDEDVKLAFYRIAQEGLNNVIKHSRAKKVTLYLFQEPDTIDLILEDDGIGFTPNLISSDHFGLKIMQERAEGIGANFSVLSEPGHGTTIKVHWEK